MNKLATSLLFSIAMLAACSDDTASIGTDVMPKSDNITALSATYQITSSTVKVDSVLANTSQSQLGSIIDPEMRVRTTCDFLAQFHMPDNFALPKQGVIYTNEEGKAMADSCYLRIFFDEYYGDSLATMKLRVQELDTTRVMEENVNYYTNINPADYVNSESSVKKSVSYTVKDLSVSESQNNGTKYYRSIRVKLPDSYGDFLLNTYYAHPEYFTNSYSFIHHVCPGFYFEHTGGTGSMITAKMMSLDVYFRYHSKTDEGNDTIVDGMQRMGATEEVIQNTRIENDYPLDKTIEELNNQACTYLKTPTGLFTEVTLPVSDIVAGEHYTDSLNQVKIVFRRYNSTSTSDFKLPKPQYVLLVRKSQMKSFFEEDKLSNSTDSYLSEYNSTNNVYQFSNISALITLLKNERDNGAGVVAGESEDSRNTKYAAWEAENPDWNKVIIIPVNAEYTTKTNSYTGTSTKTLLSIKHNLGLSSTRIEGGKDTPIDITVIYSRYNR